MEKWNVARSAALYGIENWGEGYFEVNAQGNVCVRPEKGAPPVDLHELVGTLVKRGINVPVLLRFDGIIRDRVSRIFNAFQKAIEDFGYRGDFQGVFPIKVNQQRHVVDTVRTAGREMKLGLEVGSKPELIAVLAIHDTPGALLLCNGYKDKEYIELALLARKIGRRSIIIIEQLSEVEQILQVSGQLGIEAEIGLRMKPLSKGAGRWEASSGEKAKFGLSTSEMVLAINRLKEVGKDHWLKLLHFHVGSQITAIGAIKSVLREATRTYTEVAKLCPSLCIMDVGGGLAVDYDGSRTNFQSSMNYSVEEYARDVVYAIHEACLNAELPAPTIVTESGRATVAHHAVLIAEVLDVAPSLEVVTELDKPPSDHELLDDYTELYNKLTVKNCHETLHDVMSLRDVVVERFIQGDLSLLERAYADKCFWHLIAKIRAVASDLKYMPEDIEKLEEQLKDTYFCNFSVFQSVPDSWAIDQLFPITPIHGLKEEPTRRAILADMSCDSDGKIDRFIDLKDVKRYLNLHPMKPGEPYYLGIFLVGAYQEILGDLHNLFGDTNAVHVNIDQTGQVQFTHVVEGDTVREALTYVQYDPHDLTERLRQSVEKSLREGVLTDNDSAKIQKRFKEAMEGYTYLCVEPENDHRN
jgi:arginine decarboxylase